jgi:hypothetical protein
VQVEGCGQKPVVPATGDIVTLRILSVNPRFAKVPAVLRSRILDPVPFCPLDRGSRIPNPYFLELSDNFLGKKFYNSLKIGPNLFLQYFKAKIICKICGYIKSYDNNFFFTPLFCCCFWIRDPGWVKIRIRDRHPESATLGTGMRKRD